MADRREADNGSQNEQVENELAEKHAKRLKQTKSSRVSIGRGDALKPPRSTTNRMQEANFAVSAIGKGVKNGMVQAKLPQSIIDMNNRAASSKQAAADDAETELPSTST